MPDKRLKGYKAVIDAPADGRTFTARITTDSLDRDGEVLIPGGMDAADYLKNPVVFWNHDYSTPIGTAKKIDKTANGWTAAGVMAARPKDHPEAAEWLPDTIHALMQQGVVRGVSVGFIPTETRKPSKADLEKYGDGLRGVHNRWKLLEFSVTPLPANQDALITTVSKGIVTPAQLKSLGIEAPQIEPKRRRVVLVGWTPPAKPAPKPKQIDYAAMVRREVARVKGRMYE